MTTHPLRLSRLALLTLALHATAARGAPECPQPADIEPAMLVGRWRVEWPDAPAGDDATPWQLVLSPHPDYRDSLRGLLTRGTQQVLVAADWDDDTLTMEESADGQRIDATWQASASRGQCGRVLEGQRVMDGAPDTPPRRFRLRRLP